MRTGRCSSQESRLSLICYQGHCHNGSLGGRRCCWQLFGCRDPHRQLAAVANFVLGNQTGLPQPDDPPSPSPSGDPPLGASSTSTTSVWWGEWNFRVLLSWTNLMVFSTPDRQGSLGTEGGWALYLLDKLGVISFGRYWPVAGWTALATLVIGLLTALVWSLKACEKWVCCGCGCGRRGHRDGHQLVDPALRHQPVTPAPAAYAPVTLVGPGSSTPVDTEYFQRQVRGRGTGRRPHDLVLRFPQGAVRMQPDWTHRTRIDRHGLWIKPTTRMEPPHPGATEGSPTRLSQHSKHHLQTLHQLRRMHQQARRNHFRMQQPQQLPSRRHQQPRRSRMQQPRRRCLLPLGTASHCHCHPSHNAHVPTAFPPLSPHLLHQYQFQFPPIPPPPTPAPTTPPHPTPPHPNPWHQ